jgi:hypothetical protein
MSKGRSVPEVTARLVRHYKRTRGDNNRGLKAVTIEEDNRGLKAVCERLDVRVEEQLTCLPKVPLQSTRCT